MRLLCVAASALLLAGCADDVWDPPPGASQADFNRATGSCQMYAMSMPQQRAAQLPPVYTAQTTYSGTVMPVGNMAMVNGTANTTYQAQPNPGQGFADLGAALGNIIQQKQAMRSCMESNGFTLHTDAPVPASVGGPTLDYSTPEGRMAVYKRCVSLSRSNPSTCGKPPT